MSFQQGLSGLNAAAKSLDVIGNNIANASTVGFKGSTTQFADVYASALNGAGGMQAGIGVKVAAIAQQFTQGNIESSNNPLDIAINGSGFFRVEQAGVVQYSRNGQFSLDKQGYIVNAQGAKLTGYGLGANGQLAAGAPVPLRIDTSDQPPKVSTKGLIQLQLDSRSTAPANSPFDPSDPTTYNKQVPMAVYDTLGNSHTLSTYYVRDKDNPEVWNVYASKDGTELNALAAVGMTQTDEASVAANATWTTANNAVPKDATAVAGAAAGYARAAAAAIAAKAGELDVKYAASGNAAEISAAALAAAAVPGATPADIDAAIAKELKMEGAKVGSLVFNTNGSLNMAESGNSEGKNGKFDFAIPVVPATGAEPVLKVQIDFAGTTQYGTATSEKRIEQDGYKPGALQRFTTGADGTILGQYSNGQTKALGQVVLANFSNPNGLEPLGNNAWAESANSGVPLIGVAGTGGMGVMQSNATEASSVDLTAELVNMITAQRVYQANSQTIKTQDSVMQTLVNLR
ncbi:flagellar hook protein FlgE [Massilia timonae]|uniref:flagellar hook protein FlgE n=1 Tax=Massilia timonae TaxID=47229 RepID=UPI0028CFECF6|nr:flagellar hook protein FlgE [Massilia timonae]